MEITQRVEKIIDQIQLLGKTCYPQYKLPIEYLTIFSQSEEDFSNLRENLKGIGDETEANNGFKYNLKEPDIHRKELGCGDLKYMDKDYADLRAVALRKGLDIILRDDYEMIELADFDTNVYAYLVRDL